jgi:diguanylate cyclase (GGDEF)-like protein/PAS domain S-box-containing protein
MANGTEVGTAPPSVAPTEQKAGRARAVVKVATSPVYLAYLFGPAAFVAILVLMHFGYVVHEPAWLWALVFVAVPLANLTVDRLYARQPQRWALHLRIGVQAAAVTVVIYLSGWGPVLWGAFAFLALENVTQQGSRVWRTTAFWSLSGILVGQLCIWQGWMPSVLSLARGTGVAIMGGFVMIFVIRMAGAVMEQKENAIKGMEVALEGKEAAQATLLLSEDRFRSLIQNSSDVTMVIDASIIFRYVSPGVTDLLGFEPEELVGRRATDLAHPDDGPRLHEGLGAQLQVAARSDVIQLRLQRKDGSWCDVEAVVSNQLDRPSIAGYVANVRDITERKRFEALLAHRALHDPLTGLANRQLILDRADQMLARARRTGEPVAAYFIDLDNFKDANDSLGHEAGDLLLKAVAGRLLGLLRASDSVGRLGGDEFVILAEGMSLDAGPQLVAGRIREALREPFRVEGFEGVPITVTASVGIAVGDRSAAQDLLRDADIALYRCKAEGRDRAVLFEPAMQSAAADRLELRSDLDVALQNGEFFLLYQPIFDLENFRIRGMEALLRWKHPTKGTIMPDTFIPVLEDSRQIVDVGRWVLAQACRQAAIWHARGYRTTLSVNVSIRHLEADQLIEDVRDALVHNAFDPSSLTIEVTESSLMKDANATVTRLKRLKELGVVIAIDDFGTGYSSLAYLRQFPVDVIKIDRSFVSEMDGSAEAAALIHALVELGRTLGLVTLAEGIEEDAQLDALREMQCGLGQGYIFSPPVAPADAEALLSRASAGECSAPPTLVRIPSTSHPELHA